MANTVIALRKSATPSAVPTSLANGEIAINYADGILYYKAANGTIASISGAGYNFGTVNANGTLLVSDTVGDVVGILPGNNITIVGDAINDRLTINADLTAANSWANTKLSNATVTLAGSLTTTGTVTANAYVYITPAGGEEGGEIQLQSTGANTSWSIDSYQNNYRVFARTGSTVSNVNFFHAQVGGSVRMGVNRTDPGYTVDVSGIVNASAIYVNGSPIGSGSMDYAYVNTSTAAANNYAGAMANSGNSWTQTIVDANLVTARAYTNTSTAAANNYAGAMANSANAVATATFGTITNTTAAFAKANAALANTSGVYFNGNLFFPSGNVGVGVTSTTYKLEVGGSFAAQTKSFVISHPTKSGMFLRHGSLEGPENGVYVRGRLDGSKVIELPDYWEGLIDQETITVNLTAIGHAQNLYVAAIDHLKIHIDTENHTYPCCYYTVYAERKDVDKLVVEF